MTLPKEVKVQYTPHELESNLGRHKSGLSEGFFFTYCTPVTTYEQALRSGVQAAEPEWSNEGIAVENWLTGLQNWSIQSPNISEEMWGWVENGNHSTMAS